MSNLEAYIEFGEDEQIFRLEPSILASLNSVYAKIESHLSDNRRGEIARDGARICILGKPNAGKSSLFNFLVQRKASIVSNIPGTTRDIIQSFLNMGGYAVQLFDTAGIRTLPTCPIELEGITLGLEQARSADFFIFAIDVSIDQSPEAYLSWLKESIPDVASDNGFIERSIFLLCKSDLLGSQLLIESISASWKRIFNEHVFLILVVEPGPNMSKFFSALQAMISKRVRLDDPSGPCIILRERHRYHLNELLKFLRLAISVLSKGNEDELIMASDCLKQACNQIGCISGKITSDEILDSLFKDFCIGK